ncbi:SDR family oxidoreductase [Bradyrhizobium sp. B124]|uniref:SDR family oxidoreductase n=1 Tax=Bradyrhizobium sp. B124 TaxID=3140245 RepID=UPI003183988A
MSDTILITGAESGFGEEIAFGLAESGHEVIATARTQDVADALQTKARTRRITLKSHKLNVRNATDIDAILPLDFGILVNNIARGEGGPISEIPLEILHSLFETNVFGPLALIQKVVRKWVAAGTRGKIVFVSSVASLEFPPVIAPFASGTHALEVISRALHHELKPFGIQVQTINPGPAVTRFDEGMIANAFGWLDDSRNFTKQASLRAEADAIADAEALQVDPDQMIRRMVEIIPARTGRYRNVYPEEMRKHVEIGTSEAFDLEI